MSKPYQDEAWLREQWFSEKTVLDIANEVGCDPSTITRWARKFDLPHKSDASPWRDEETLRRLYHDERMSLQDVANRLGCTASTIKDNMKANGIERRSMKRGQALSNPQVQHWHTSLGYEQVGAEIDGEKRTALVHQLIAIANGADPHRLFGRGPDVVHHKNGIKWDNRPSNIEIMDRKEHGRMHAEEQIENKQAWHQQ